MFSGLEEGDDESEFYARIKAEIDNIMGKYEDQENVIEDI
jgi:hypothetical protein